MKLCKNCKWLHESDVVSLPLGAGLYWGSLFSISFGGDSMCSNENCFNPVNGNERAAEFLRDNGPCGLEGRFFEEKLR